MAKQEEKMLIWVVLREIIDLRPTRAVLEPLWHLLGSKSYLIIGQKCRNTATEVTGSIGFKQFDKKIGEGYYRHEGGFCICDAF